MGKPGGHSSQEDFVGFAIGTVFSNQTEYAGHISLSYDREPIVELNLAPIRFHYSRKSAAVKAKWQEECDVFYFCADGNPTVSI
jgi:hypothetical protein